MTEEIDWKKELQARIPGARLNTLTEPMQQALSSLATDFGVDRVVEVFTSEPHETGGERKFPRLRPDLDTQVLCEKLHLADSGSPVAHRADVERIAPVIIALYDKTSFFDQMSYPSPYGEDVAWFTKPGEPAVQDLPLIKAQTEYLRTFLEKQVE